MTTPSVSTYKIDTDGFYQTKNKDKLKKLVFHFLIESGIMKAVIKQKPKGEYYDLYGKLPKMA